MERVPDHDVRTHLKWRHHLLRLHPRLGLRTRCVRPRPHLPCHRRHQLCPRSDRCVWRLRHGTSLHPVPHPIRLVSADCACIRRAPRRCLRTHSAPSLHPAATAPFRRDPWTHAAHSVAAVASPHPRRQRGRGQLPGSDQRKLGTVRHHGHGPHGHDHRCGSAVDVGSHTPAAEVEVRSPSSSHC
ncbi:unannotated protein [freshwater metagenome]|uniref:Unannotated protein n=1 Tax=freshwater metagenome TaxID=449393 RepID=A0A6J7JER9_9ZZZZ